ncbi:MAG: error-prone DNA polymerase [Gammaproteobacteria bacterium]|nr:error-prone DNA polymerase [Gammaproteobacteria bacterium]
MSIKADFPPIKPYAELHCLSNFSFLRGASHPEELVETALTLGYSALAITDECSMAGVVRAYGRMKELKQEASDAGKELPFQLIIGSEFALDDGFKLVALVRNTKGYSRLCRLITEARRSAEKGSYQVTEEMIDSAGLEDCCLLLIPPYFPKHNKYIDHRFSWFKSLGNYTFSTLELHYGQYDHKHTQWLIKTSEKHGLIIVAAGDVHMHTRKRRALQDIVTCIRHTCTLDNAGRRLFINGERYLRDLRALDSIYPPQALINSADVAALCTFDLSELNYQYPREVVPEGMDSTEYLTQLTYEGMRWRWPDGADEHVQEQIDYELKLIQDMQYESYFLTVYDIVNFARNQNILCQGRGSAANSAVCFSLGITEVDPSRTSMLFERFISRERDEPPDIDVDFEHERREEVIQYIYAKYGRHRAALAATVVTYRKKSAVRDIGKAIGLSEEQVDALSKSLAWWDGANVIGERLESMGFDPHSPLMKRFAWLLEQLLGFPRHLSQHVGGFVISDRDLSTLVPVENAAMPDRTIIQWDKDDLEELGLLKVDVLALGMLTAIRKSFEWIARYHGTHYTMASIPPDDTPTYDMICKADTMGVFQIESRAQMSMLPRLRPRNYYDLVIEVAIVRPGPIQGGMVNPYLQRRQGTLPVTYPNKDLERVLERTLGVPVFQEQVMEIAMVAAGFTAGEADQLRRSMAAWRRAGAVSTFREKLIGGMLKKGYEEEFAEAIFKQVEGFGEYGFPESHAASFALLVYVSCYLKCHYPAAFLCAMLNSQPLGFYDPSDLTQDARRHGVQVLPVDINLSDQDHKMVRGDNGPAVRLGFRLVSKLSSTGAEKILGARESSPFTSAEDLVRRTGINRTDQQALAIAGALKQISGSRHDAQWDLLGVEQLPKLLSNASAKEPNYSLPLPTEGEDIVADYLSTGLTLGRHPLALLRSQLTERRILDSAAWESIPDGKSARLAGIIKVRQRPGSANGVLFMTLEDEHGCVNVIIWEAVVERYRKQILGTTMVCVSGVTQREQGVCHLVAKQIEDLSWMLGELSTHSRNFH